MFITINTHDLQFDTYCTECQKDSLFRNSYIKNNHGFSSDTQNTILERNLNTILDTHEIHFSCTRDTSHIYFFTFRIANYTLTKIGQFPSIASLQISNIKKYQNILKSDYRDFSKAIGLFSHGVGSGSFVYLRRIFENLIEEEHIAATQNEHWDEQAYKSARMDEKINLLKEGLPDFLVQNRTLYGVLSIAIHELSEEVCLDLFPQVKLAIELILDEKLVKQERQKKISEAEKFLAVTSERLKRKL